MKISSLVRDGLRAGVRVAGDRAVWYDLAATAFAPMTMLRALGMLVSLGLASMLSGLLFGGVLNLLAALGLSLWIWPPLLRWFIGTVARRTNWPLARATGLTQNARPGLTLYREWWLPVLACGVGYRLLESGGLGESIIPMLMLLALQAHLAAPALARSLLVSWFALADIDASLARDRRRWSLLTGVYALGLAIVWVVSTRAAGLQGLELFLNLLGAVANKGGLVLLLAKIVLVTALLAGAGVVATASAAAIGARWMTVEAATTAVAAGAAPGAALRVEPAMAWSLTWRHVLLMTVGGMLLVAWYLFSIRASLAPWVLGPNFGRIVAEHGDWSEPSVRDGVRLQLACDGNVADLRALHRLGVEGTGSSYDAALSCAIGKGDIRTVDALLDLGDETNHARKAGSSVPGSDDPTTPLMVAWRQSAWRDMAERLVAHGASLAPRADGLPDAVQGAAAAHCMACLTWLKSKGASFAGTRPVTPMALWLDGSENDADRVETLKALAAMGMSASAVGSDGRSALHAAARWGDPAAVAWLVAQGANPSQADSFGAVPLDHAAWPLETKDLPVASMPGQERLDTVLQLMRLTQGYAMKQIGMSKLAYYSAKDPYVPASWMLGVTAAQVPAIRAEARRLGWKMRYLDPVKVARGLSPEEGESVIAEEPDDMLAMEFWPYDDRMAVAIDAGWWPELKRASTRWNPANRMPAHCGLLKRLVSGDNDRSPRAADSWAVVQGWFNAGVHLGRCAPSDREDVERAVARLSPARRAEWAEMQRAALARSDVKASADQGARDPAL